MFGKKRFEKALANLHLIIIDHIDALAAARRKLYSPDRYGIRDPRKWIKELNYFSNNVVDARLSTWDRALIRSKWKKNYLDELDYIICQHSNVIMH